MLPLHRTAVPVPDVVDASLDEGEMALLHLGTRTYFSLNRTGARIWAHLKEGRTLEDVSRLLHEEFDVGLDDARRSVADMVEALAQHRLVDAPR